MEKDSTKSALTPRSRAVVGQYSHRSIKGRIEAFFLDNLGKVATRDQIIQVARQGSEEDPENWHQRLSELRTDDGYTILSNRDTRELKVGEYLLSSIDKRPGAGKRVLPTPSTWDQVLARAKGTCEWDEGGEKCALKHGDIDPVGGGTVKPTPDHMNPHSLCSQSDRTNPAEWRALCGRHQVMKKNYWDSTTGKLNVYAIVQSASRRDKEIVFEFLKKYFNESKD
jgi:hypothetical protein